MNPKLLKGAQAKRRFSSANVPDPRVYISSFAARTLIGRLKTSGHIDLDFDLGNERNENVRLQLDATAFDSLVRAMFSANEKKAVRAFEKALDRSARRRTKKAD